MLPNGALFFSNQASVCTSFSVDILVSRFRNRVFFSNLILKVASGKYNRFVSVPTTEYMIPQMLYVSSKKMTCYEISVTVAVGKSFLYIRNRRDPKTEPWDSQKIGMPIYCSPRLYFLDILYVQEVVPQ